MILLALFWLLSFMRQFQCHPSFHQMVSVCACSLILQDHCNIDFPVLFATDYFVIFLFIFPHLFFHDNMGKGEPLTGLGGLSQDHCNIMPDGIVGNHCARYCRVFYFSFIVLWFFSESHHHNSLNLFHLI